MATYSETIKTIVKKYYLPNAPYQLAKSTPTLAKLTDFAGASATGKELQQTLEKSDTTGGAWNDNSTFDVTNPDEFTHANWDWAFNYANITYGKREETMAQGTHAVLNIVKARLNGARRKLKQVINNQLWATGAVATSPQEIESLNAAIDDGTNVTTWGGIDRTTQTWWQSLYRDAGGASNPLTVKLIHNTKSDIGDAGDRPNLAITTQDSYDKVWEEVYDKAEGVPQDKELFEVGLESIKIGGTTLISDRNCYSGECFFLNTDYIALYQNSNMKGALRGPMKMVDQPKSSGQILDSKQLGVSAAFMHGRLYNLDES